MLKEKLPLAKTSVVRLLSCQTLCIYNNDILPQKNVEDILNYINNHYIKIYFNEENSTKNHYKNLYKTDFIKKIINGVIENQKEIDKILSKELRSYNTIENLLDTTRESFRLAIYEMQNFKDVATEIIINEYVDIIAEFTNDPKETKFANKVLENLATTIRNKTQRINTKKENQKKERKILSLKSKN